MNLILYVATFFFLFNSSAFAENHFEVTEATIDSIHTAMKNHQLTCEQLIQLYLERIKKFNLSADKQPPLNAITAINSSVIEEARAIDQAYTKTKKFIGPLHCIPVVIKDNIDSDEITTTAGSYSLIGNQPVKDAFIVTELRKAGAIILAHGAMDEFAWGMFGMSSRQGRTGNAYDATKNPGGSSGGSAVAVSANFAVIGIGTDNSGSVRIPAAFNGIVGLRPSTGLISQHGIYPMGKLDGVAGPLARTVKDLALVLDILARQDDSDPTTHSIPRVKTYMTFLNIDGLKGKRIGIVHQIGKVDTFQSMPKDVQSDLQNAYKKMQQLGATLIDPIELPKFDNHRLFNQAGEIQDVDEYLATFPATRKNFRDICMSDRTRTFGTVKECLAFLKSTPKRFSHQYQLALENFKKNKIYVEKIMDQYHLDALLIPISRVGVATYDPYAINCWQGSVSSNAGLPSITVNIGYKNQLPIGVELIGKKFQEGTLIEMAYAYEQNSLPRQIPVMPLANAFLMDYSIPKLNNLISEIGKKTYDEVFKNGKAGEDAVKNLTPEKFQLIVKDYLQNKKEK